MKFYIAFLTTFILLILIIIKQYEKINNINQQITLYQKKEDILIKQIKEIYNEKILLEEQTEKLQKASKKDYFDWNRDISNTHVIKQLQQS